MGDRIGVQLPLWEIYLSLTNHPGQLNLAIPPWVGTVSTGQRAVMLCDWGVKADMVLFARNTVWSISERVRGVCVDALYKLTFTLLLLYFTCCCVTGVQSVRTEASEMLWLRGTLWVGYCLFHVQRIQRWLQWGNCSTSDISQLFHKVHPSSILQYMKDICLYKKW